MDWHPASVSLRRGIYYVVMTVPREARAAMKGQAQVRVSARTTDRAIAEKRRFELEGQLRQRVLDAVRRHRLAERESQYQRAVNLLHLAHKPYDYVYEPEFCDVVERTFSEPPEAPCQAEQAIHEMERLVFELQELDRRPADAAGFLEMYERFEGQPPSAEEARTAVEAAKRELAASFGLGGGVLRLKAMLTRFEQTLEQRVRQGDIKQKTAKARIRHIHQFIDLVGDLPMNEVEAKHAYAFAQHLSEEHGNSTIKTRVSDISTMLEEAVRTGDLKRNPFVGLKLSGYGSKRQNYAPLTDDLLHQLFSIPKLPDEIRDLWAILVCTGMRLDEVALSFVRQIKEQDGILYFDLRGAEVKTRSSERRVPICGIVEPLVRSLLMGKQPTDRLFDFPIKAGGKSRASEKCGYWMKKVDLNRLSGDPKARYTTHSLRGTFKDKMRDAEVGLEVHNAILGHDLNTVAAGYGRGPSLRVMKAAVDKAPHPYLDWIPGAVGKLAG